MDTVAHFEGRTANIELILHIKELVDILYKKQQIFALTLETLELTRRFSAATPSYKILEEMEAQKFDRLLYLTRHLERNLTRELQ